jgi:parallel beta-helix repeat protein
MVKDCIIDTPTGAGINATDCDSLQFSYNTISRAWFGISVVVCSNIEITGNFITGSDYGIMSQFTDYCNISFNIVSRNLVGIELYYCTNWLVLNNTVIENGDVGIKLAENTYSITLFGNEIGWNNASNALDNGFSNAWDDSIAQGNYWSDYEGTGQYSIPGTAESVDYYPAVLEKSELLKI